MYKRISTPFIAVLALAALGSTTSIASAKEGADDPVVHVVADDPANHVPGADDPAVHLQAGADDPSVDVPGADDPAGHAPGVDDSTARATRAHLGARHIRGAKHRGRHVRRSQGNDDGPNHR